VLEGGRPDPRGHRRRSEGYQRAHQLGLERASGSYVASNLAAMLLFSGQWEECARLTAALLEVDSWTPFAIHTTRGLLLTRQGHFAAAREEFDHAERPAPPAQQWSVWVGRAELALWEGRHDQAATPVAKSLRWIAEQDPEGVPAQLSCLCYAPALQLEADRAELAAAQQAVDDVAAARQRAAPVIAALDRLSNSQSPQARIPVVASNLLLARAEQSRLEGRSDPERWRAAAVAWKRLAYPFEAAYARSDRPTHSWPAGHTTSRPRPYSDQPTRRRSRSGPRPCNARSSCSPDAAACALRTMRKPPRRPQRPPPRLP
jgi:hypothetical protein